MSTRPQIEIRLKAGMGTAAVAREMACSRWWVRHVKKTMGQPFKPRGRFPVVEWTPEMLAGLEDFVSGAVGLKGAARRIGVDTATMAHGLAILLRAERERSATP